LKDNNNNNNNMMMMMMKKKKKVNILHTEIVIFLLGATAPIWPWPPHFRGF
jgi:hypothetical protein